MNHVDKAGGRGVGQMSTLRNKPMYLIKLSTKGEGGVKKVPKSFYVVDGSPHYMANFFPVKSKILTLQQAPINIKRQEIAYTPASTVAPKNIGGKNSSNFSCNVLRVTLSTTCCLAKSSMWYFTILKLTPTKSWMGLNSFNWS